MTEMTDERRVAVELADLTPIELNSLIDYYDRVAIDEPLPRAPLYAEDINRLALILLERESVGDIMARIETGRGA